MSRKSTFLLAIFAYVTLLLLAILFYKERTVIMDVSFLIFSTIHDQSFAIQCFRFGAVLTQIFPVVTSLFHLPLSWIAISCSVSFIIYYFTCFIVCFRFFKDEKMALVLLLFNTIMVSHTFYWIQCELIQGTALTVVYFSALGFIMQKQKIKIGWWVLLFILNVTCCFFHPSIVFLFFFLTFYFLISYSEQKKMILLSLLVFCLAAAVKNIFFKTQYDTDSMSGLKHIAEMFPNYFKVPSNHAFINWCLTDYWFVPILLFASIFIYVKTKAWKKLSVLIFFFFGYLFVVNMVMPSWCQQFYYEAQYQILAVMVAVPFVFDVLPRIKKQNVKTILLSGMMIICVARIYSNHTYYSMRLNWHRNFLNRTAHAENKKIILPPNYVSSDTMLLTWGSSFEFWLLSTIETGESRSIIMEERQNEFDQFLPANNKFITMWQTLEYDKLDKKYFIFNDTTAYKKYLPNRK